MSHFLQFFFSVDCTFHRDVIKRPNCDVPHLVGGKLKTRNAQGEVKFTIMR
jgi:hypothetical protein